jgi:hypothetical protein
VSITRQTLRLDDEMRLETARQLDDDTRVLVAAWVRAWNTLNNEWRRAIDELVAATGPDRWPNQRQILDFTRIQLALAATTAELDRLARLTGSTTVSTATALTEQQAFWEARILASQMPAKVDFGSQMIATRLSDLTLAAIVERTTQHIESRENPLAAGTAEQMKRALIRGVALGQNPRRTADQMLARSEQTFNGGLTRALNISRTESLDAQRTAAGAYQQQHQDVLKGWAWTAKLDARTCPSCWSKHGQVHPLTEPGPHDHHQGRCSRTPVTRSWAELGIAMPEPPSALPNAQRAFENLPRAEQLRVMGPARLAALEDGTLTWDQLSVNVTNPGWRDSWVPVSVRQTRNHQRMAGAAAV